MAIGILGIIYAVLIALCILFIFSLFFKGGYYVSNTWIFAFVQVFIILLSVFYISSLPDNYIMNKGIGGLLICTSIFNIWFKEKNFFAARMISVVLILVALFLLCL